MGLNFSSMLAGASAEKPKTVLVPPMFERDLKARSRMVKSSYDYLFAKPSLRWLFEDYMGSGLNTVLLFAPAVDPRISVKAKLGAGQAGMMSLRYQPFGLAEPLCFVDIKASPRSPGDVTLRACAFSTDTGLGSFATLPLAKHVSGKRAEVGVRYSSPIFTAGTVLQPATNKLSHLWLCGRHEGMTLGVQLRPDLPVHDLQGGVQQAVAAAGSSSSSSSSVAAGDVAGWLRGVSSVALSYSPEGRTRAVVCGDVAGWLRGLSSVALSYRPEGRTRAGQHSFTASMEMQEGQNFIISFFQHMAAVRQVFNPLEKDDVIGITNYIDVGIQLHVPLAAAATAAAVDGKGAAGATPFSSSSSSSGDDALAGLRLAASWQVNKNVYLKGRLGGDGVALMAAFKSWFQPSVAFAAAVERSFVTGKMRTGLTVQVENFGRLRYERSREALAHGRILTQRHEATDAELAMAEGDRPLVGRRAADEDFNMPEAASTAYL
ncbi:hypothetical protein OEZ85_000289 [Tetradesmus obliquus]|uniref:Bacterial surface antigen (D15) domain-containing protein n=1 Tax=Tetradesmus obliquus TaxID=3088 RepID=A0ABY8UTA8_TETOB|nr:hypothetical protein OEZ85_000289 [Tetradesmus obliquus]